MLTKRRIITVCTVLALIACVGCITAFAEFGVDKTAVGNSGTACVNEFARKEF